MAGPVMQGAGAGAAPKISLGGAMGGAGGGGAALVRVGLDIADAHQLFLPNRPSGLIISTMAMMTKMTTAEPAG